MMRILLFIAAAFAALWSSPSQAQNVNLNCYVGPNAPQWLPCSATNPLPTTGGGLSGNLGNNVDNVAPVATGNVGADSYEYVFDGTNWQRAQPVNAGTAGVPGTDVLSVQGIAGMTPVTVGGQTSEVCVSPTVTASAYTAGNVVGGKMTLANAFRAAGSGVLQSIRVTFKDVQTAEFDAYEFSANPTGSTWTDKAAPAIVAADVLLSKPPIKLTNNASGLGTSTVYGADAIGRAVAEGGTSDYFVLVTTGTPTFASTSDVQFCASYLQD